MDPIEKVKEILKKHNIRMSVNSCGCCDGSWVAFEHGGKMILGKRKDEEIETDVYVSFNMFKED